MNTYHNVAIKEIDVADYLYCIKAPAETGDLFDSIKAIGLLTPVYLQKKGNTAFRIVCGFRRVAAALALGMECIPAFVVETDIPPLQVFAIQLYDNLSIRPFKPSELVSILQKLQELGCSCEDLIQTWLPRFGFGKNPRVYELYNSLPGLEAHWLQALDEEQIAIDLLSLLAQAEQSDREAFWRILQALKPGKNNQREYWSLCRDIARIGKNTVAEVLNKPDIEKIITDAVLSPAQKGERFKQALWELRYPRYMQVKTQVQTLIKKAKLPPDLQVIPSPYFDDSACTVSFVFKNELDYEQKLVILQSMCAEGIIKSLFGLVK